MADPFAHSPAGGLRPLATLERLRPYQAASLASPVLHNLSANEACLGASALAVAAAMDALRQPERYPDGNARALRAAIGRRHGVDPDRIVCGAGSEELITLLIQAYVGPGEEVLFPQYGFIKYELAARACGARPVRAADRAYTADVQALLAAVTTRTRAVFLANPNNPTGTMVSGDALRQLRQGLRPDILLVIDSAYAEFVEDATYDSGGALALETTNTVMLRTFSKIHGLAGLRCGWALADGRIIESINRVRGAFNVGAASQAAAAAAIADLAHEREARRHNTAALAWLQDSLRAAGHELIPSVCNFVVVLFRDAPACAAAAAALAGHGILALPLGGYGLDRALRISVGTDEANRAVVAALAAARA